LALEAGGRLQGITVAYETWGRLNRDASNAILVCHALTGDAHAAGRSGPGQPTTGWWDDLIGPGRALDTDRYFVVCSNVLGGCQGTTGPASIDPDSGRPWGSRFPVVSIRDMVRVQRFLTDQLGVEQWLSVVGGSMGGMQVLEWGVLFPQRMRSLVPIASTAAASAQQVSWSAVGRMAVCNDPRWRGGDYYEAAPGDGPQDGLALARQIAQIHYRSEAVFEERFGRRLVGPATDRFGLGTKFDVESYLDYQGTKLVARFDANTYLLLNRAMDFHDLARGRGSLEAALARIDVPVGIMSITTDTLYPPYQQQRLRDALRSQGTPVDYVDVESPHGHDGFLLEFEQVGAAIEKFLGRL
ncbi:MAG: homoserine O-acetyltransferase, partial [Acidimicrobiia bacterium]|nr:homoserine O-acetyltransferase [Acidimicrobiia bacterium]